MSELNFHVAGTTGLKGSSVSCDFWIRSAKNKVSGVGVHYVALTQRFVDNHLMGHQKDVVSKTPYVEIAIDIRSRVLVGGVDEGVVRPSSIKKLKARSGTAFYHTSKSLVLDLIEEFKVNTDKDNHYFRLVPDGSYHDCPRFMIVEVTNL